MARMMSSEASRRRWYCDVGEGLLRRHGDGVAGVDAHGVDVLDGADDDHVVLEVAHDLELELLPADDALLEQHLVGGRGVEAGLDHRVELLVGGGHPSPVPAQGEAGPDDEGQAEAVVERGAGLGHAVDHRALGHAQADGGHGGRGTRRGPRPGGWPRSWRRSAPPRTSRGCRPRRGPRPG